jgi:SAM-dependent methyltransferase
MTNYQEIALHYKNCLEKHGDTALGLDWPNENDMFKRYDVMLGLIKKYDSDLTLLDLGCGTSGLLEYINGKHINNIHYAGLDINKEFIEISKKKYPSIDYYCSDILLGDIKIPNFDYIVMNGIFTVKRSLSFDDMFNFMKEMLKIVSLKVNIGFAFNVMSKQVDWERDDLFHLPLDLLSNFLVKNISRNFIIRNDYGLFEYTVYVYPNNKTSGN